MRTFIGPDIILSDLTEGPTLFAQSEHVREYTEKRSAILNDRHCAYHRGRYETLETTIGKKYYYALGFN